MKIDARLVKQSVGMIVGGVIFAWSAMDKGRIDGIKEGKRLPGRMDNTSNRRRVRKGKGGWYYRSNQCQIQ